MAELPTELVSHDGLLFSEIEPGILAASNGVMRLKDRNPFKDKLMLTPTGSEPDTFELLPTVAHDFMLGQARKQLAAVINYGISIPIIEE